MQELEEEAAKYEQRLRSAGIQVTPKKEGVAQKRHRRHQIRDRKEEYQPYSPRSPTKATSSPARGHQEKLPADARRALQRHQEKWSGSTSQHDLPQDMDYQRQEEPPCGQKDGHGQPHAAGAEHPRRRQVHKSPTPGNGHEMGIADLADYNLGSHTQDTAAVGICRDIPGRMTRTRNPQRSTTPSRQPTNLPAATTSVTSGRMGTIFASVCTHY